MFLIKEIEFIQLENGDIFMVNLINSAADIINSELHSKLVNSEFDSIDAENIKVLRDRKYLFASHREYDLFISNINNRINTIEELSTPKFLIIPTYACNLNCVYCYEQTYMIKGTSNLEPIKLINLQFKQIKRIVKQIEDKKGELIDGIRITIMGGEPLLAHNYVLIEHILKNAEENDYTVDIVTNGVDLSHFLTLFNEYSNTLAHLQITIDGIEEIHDQGKAR